MGQEGSASTYGRSRAAPAVRRSARECSSRPQRLTRWARRQGRGLSARAVACIPLTPTASRRYANYRAAARALRGLSLRTGSGAWDAAGTSESPAAGAGPGLWEASRANIPVRAVTRRDVRGESRLTGANRHKPEPSWHGPSDEESWKLTLFERSHVLNTGPRSSVPQSTEDRQSCGELRWFRRTLQQLKEVSVLCLAVMGRPPES